ncbi:MAG: SDR family NAD(P)-dependent oxidoreductase, partial [Streptosporangiaceae bacterium]
MPDSTPAPAPLADSAAAEFGGLAAIVTGGASGIGAACARTLAREGAKVLITDLDPAGEAVAGEIGGAFLRHDVSDEAGWAEVIATAERRFGALHIMIANAGIGIGKPIL